MQLRKNISLINSDLTPTGVLTVVKWFHNQGIYEPLSLVCSPFDEPEAQRLIWLYPHTIKSYAVDPAFKYDIWSLGTEELQIVSFGALHK